MHPGDYDFGGHFVIGMEVSQKFALFYRIKNDKVLTHCIDLSAIDKCEMIKRTKNIKDAYGNHNHIEKVEVSFKLKENAKETIGFELFCKEANVQLNVELNVAEE